MRAIQIEAFGTVDQLKEVDLPIPKPWRGEIRVKIHYSGFNPVDAKMRSGVYNDPLPIVLGADFCGTVDAMGDLVRDFEVGQEVIGLAYKHSSNGTYADYLCLPAFFCAPKPAKISRAEAAAVPLTYLTAFQALIGKGALQKNRPLFLSGGSGGVGSAAIALAKVYDSGPIFNMAGGDESVSYLQKHLAVPQDRILRYRNLSIDQMAEKLIEMNNKERFYFALDFVGGSAKELCIQILDCWGHLATTLPETEKSTIPVWGRTNNLIWAKSLSLHMTLVFSAIMNGTEASCHAYKAHLKHLVDLFDRENLIPPLITEVGAFSVETVKAAHNQLESGHTQGKLVMNHQS